MYQYIRITYSFCLLISISLSNRLITYYYPLIRCHTESKQFSYAYIIIEIKMYQILAIHVILFFLIIYISLSNKLSNQNQQYDKELKRRLSIVPTI